MTQPRDIAKSIFGPQQVSQQAVKVIEQRAASKGDGIETGIADLDRHLIPMRPGELIVVLGYTSNYKSGLMNYVARYHARQIRMAGEAGKKIIITFTWEQSIEEQGIVDISQIVQIPTDKMMRGELNSDEWLELHRGAIARGALPWWLVGHSIDSNDRRPRLSMSDVYSAMAHIVDVQKTMPVLIVLDYLQRMPLENSRRDHRVQFMEMVDAAKDLALAFHSPVMLGTQAGRQIKSRAWRLPQADDGQECLAGDTVLVHALTGETKTVKEWYENSSELWLHSMSDNWHLSSHKSYPIKPAGVQNIYKIVAAGGKTIRVSGNHPLYTSKGWKRADELRAGDYVAYARRLEVNQEGGLDDELALLLGLLLGDGSYRNGRTPALSCGHRGEIADLAADIVIRRFALIPNKYIAEDGNIELSLGTKVNGGPGGNRLIDWLREIGLYGQAHNDAKAPQEIFKSSLPAVAAFLRGLFIADGSFPKSQKPSSPVIVFNSASEVLANQVQMLLLRLGIQAHMRVQAPSGRTKLPIHHVTITGMGNVSVFMKKIHFLGSKQERALMLWNSALSVSTGKLRSHLTLPPDLSLQFIELVKEHHMRTAYGMSKGRRISYIKALKAAREMQETEWVERIEGDIEWVNIKDVIKDGQEMTYDIYIPPEHNFVANGFIVHNTSNLEQSADKLLSVWMPKNDYPTGQRIEYGSDAYTVTDNLLILGLLKQKFGPAPRIFGLYVRPEINEIFMMNRLEDAHQYK